MRFTVRILTNEETLALPFARWTQINTAHFKGLLKYLECREVVKEAYEYYLNQLTFAVMEHDGKYYVAGATFKRHEEEHA